MHPPLKIATNFAILIKNIAGLQYEVLGNAIKIEGDLNPMPLLPADIIKQFIYSCVVGYIHAA